MAVISSLELKPCPKMFDWKTGESQTLSSDVPFATSRLFWPQVTLASGIPEIQHFNFSKTKMSLLYNTVPVSVNVGPHSSCQNTNSTNSSQNMFGNFFGVSFKNTMKIKINRKTTKYPIVFLSHYQPWFIR